MNTVFRDERYTDDRLEISLYMRAGCCSPPAPLANPSTAYCPSPSMLRLGTHHANDVIEAFTAVCYVFKILAEGFPLLQNLPTQSERKCRHRRSRQNSSSTTNEPHLTRMSRTVANTVLSSVATCGCEPRAT